MPKPTPTDPSTEAAAPGRFRLMRYFTLATLAVFAAAGVALYVLQRMEESFFDRVQQQQRAFFAKAQADLAAQNEAAARASLMAVHESAHVTLTRVVANLLWASDIAPFVARAQALSVEPCRALPKEQRRPCLAALGERIRALSSFAALDAKAYAAMRTTKVFKIKVWDLRGVAVYSSEHAQIGDDGAGNAGWRAAAQGRPASELTHRDRFSAFEGTVENRDLISTYVPVNDEKTGAVVGVFELYSDVTPFLEQTRAASRRFAEIAAANDAEVVRTSETNQRLVVDSSDRFLLIVGGLLVLLYVAALVIVRIGQRIIDRQAAAQEAAAQREQRWHREKMAALSAMAANVSHEVGNPLAVISGVAQQWPDGDAARAILAQTGRVAQMMRQISDFAAVRSGAPEWVDVNAKVKAVCDFHAFDRRFRATPVSFEPGAQLPACELVPDHLDEVMMGLLQAGAESAGEGGRLEVSTRLDDGAVAVRIGGAGADALPDALRRRVQQMGATLAPAGGGLELRLPTAPAAGRA